MAPPPKTNLASPFFLQYLWRIQNLLFVENECYAIFRSNSRVSLFQCLPSTLRVGSSNNIFVIFVGYTKVTALSGFGSWTVDAVRCSGANKVKPRFCMKIFSCCKFSCSENGRVGRGLHSSMDWIGLGWIGLDWVKSLIYQSRVHRNSAMGDPDWTGGRAGIVDNWCLWIFSRLVKQAEVCRHSFSLF